jgi:hypothetical protein
MNCFKRKAPHTPRHIDMNDLGPVLREAASNEISTSQYTILTFLPVNLFQ